MSFATKIHVYGRAGIWHITKLCDFMHVALLTESGFCSPISACINWHLCVLRWALKCSCPLRVGSLHQFNFSPWSIQFIRSHAVSHRYQVTATRVWMTPGQCQWGFESLDIWCLVLVTAYLWTSNPQPFTATF